MRSTASRNVSIDDANEKRTKSFPAGPKAAPGMAATPPSSSITRHNSSAGTPDLGFPQRLHRRCEREAHKIFPRRSESRTRNGRHAAFVQHHAAQLLRRNARSRLPATSPSTMRTRSAQNLSPPVRKPHPEWPPRRLRPASRGTTPPPERPISASRNVSIDDANEKRTKSFPAGPKAAPGMAATPPSSSITRHNSSAGTPDLGFPQRLHRRCEREAHKIFPRRSESRTRNGRHAAFVQHHAAQLLRRNA